MARSMKISGGLAPSKNAKVTAKPRPGGRSADVRARIFAATFELLQQGLSSQLGFAHVAELANVHISTLYRQWGSFENLLSEMALSSIGNQSIDNDIDGGDGDLANFLMAYLPKVQRLLQSPLYRHLINVWASTDKIKQQAVQQTWYRLCAPITTRVEVAVAKGILSSQADPHLIADQLTGPLILWALSGTKFDVLRLATHVETIIARYKKRNEALGATGEVAKTATRPGFVTQ